MKKISILAVDDRPENLLVLENLLESPELEIVKAGSGDEALSKTIDHEFALILLDVQMPDMDGYETAELLRSVKKTSTIPIIFVTAANKEDHHVFKGYESGAVDYLFKPLEPVILTSKVKIFIELYKQRIRLEEKTRELDAKVIELEALKLELEHSNKRLRHQSYCDGLTKLPNRRFFDQTLIKEWRRSTRDKKPLSMLLIDIDNFKAYNDTYGHLAGDDCLRKVATQLLETIFRDVDTIARYGGEEFAVILPETDSDGGEMVAKRMLESISALHIEHETSQTGNHVTISIGLGTVMPTDDFRETTLIDLADKALYRAKESGRNNYQVSNIVPDQD